MIKKLAVISLFSLPALNAMDMASTYIGKLLNQAASSPGAAQGLAAVGEAVHEVASAASSSIGKMLESMQQQSMLLTAYGQVCNTLIRQVETEQNEFEREVKKRRAEYESQKASGAPIDQQIAQDNLDFLEKEITWRKQAFEKRAQEISQAAMKHIHAKLEEAAQKTGGPGCVARCNFEDEYKRGIEHAEQRIFQAGGNGKLAELAACDHYYYNSEGFSSMGTNHKKFVKPFEEKHEAYLACVGRNEIPREEWEQYQLARLKVLLYLECGYLLPEQKAPHALTLYWIDKRWDEKWAQKTAQFQEQLGRALHEGMGGRSWDARPAADAAFNDQLVSLIYQAWK